MQNLDAIVILTNQCNLNCAYCIYACDLRPSPYYITIEELKTTLNLMKQKLPSLNKLILSGGDAFMHPHIIQICEEVRKIFPTIELCAYTNGLLLNKFTDQEIIYLTKQLRLNIISSLYPSVKNLDEYKKQDMRFKQLGTNLYYQSSHFYFNKQNYKYHNLNFPQKVIEENFDKCRTLTKYNSLITIYRNKILPCCGEVGFLNNGKNADTSDLLDLNTLISEQQIIDFCEKPHNICKDCIANAHKSNCTVLWSKKNAITEKHQENSLEMVFLKNYSDYKKLYLDNQEHLICFNDPFFYEKFLPDVNPGEFEFLHIKYKNGLGDIFIPYDNDFNEEKRIALHRKLLEITNIDKYNLYFVGINTSQKYNQLMYKQFKQSGFDSPLKTTFLLGQNLLQGYSEFLQYSYLNNKILLDVNDFLKSNKRSF